MLHLVEERTFVRVGAGVVPRIADATGCCVASGSVAGRVTLVSWTRDIGLWTGATLRDTDACGGYTCKLVMSSTCAGKRGCRHDLRDDACGVLEHTAATFLYLRLLQAQLSTGHPACQVRR